MARRIPPAWLIVASLALLLGSRALPPGPVHATVGTTYYVGTTSDSTAAVSDCATSTNSDCTLRDAIAVATLGVDRIHFGAGVTGTITLGTGAGQGTLTLAHSVTITGPGASTLAVDGANAVTVFMVNSASRPRLTA